MTKNFIRKANYWATPIYEKLPTWCFPERHLRFKAYCVGAAKTGTITIHITFSNQYRSAHEPENRFLVNKIVALAKGKIDNNEFTKYVKHRDRRLSLEMDSSHFNYFLIDILVSEFSEAKFILTIRDCYSWLDSLINHYLARPELRNKHWSKQWLIELDKLCFKANEFEHANKERILADHGLYTLDGYFSFWMEHNSKVLATVPEENLLVVKTQEIGHSIPKIEAFLGIKSGTLPTHARGNVATKKFNILSNIDKDFLEERANAHCKPLMDRYFPEIQGFGRKNS